MIHFPYYGDTLYELVEGVSPEKVAEIVVRGTDTDAEKRDFELAILQEIQAKAGISDNQVADLVGDPAAERGVLNWPWVRGILKSIDRFVPNGSSASIALFTHDVYEYLKNSAVRQKIDDGVLQAMKPGVETVVVGHSLGTIVSYALLRTEGARRGWKVPLYVTVGSPLAITAVRKALRTFASTARCPECVSKWFNAMDQRDIVALYPLDTEFFPLNPVDPCIENKIDVQNDTDNRHGIVGYLNDKEVAKRIFDALVA